MITLSKKLREAREKKQDGDVLHSNESGSKKKSTIRDQLLTKEVVEVGKHFTSNCHIVFDDPDKIYQFTVMIKPDEGMWKGGTFKFDVFVPEDYNFKPPLVKCKTRVWHPNINLDGSVCLSILREQCLDGSGWSPTRSIKDILWGLQSLFIDLVDFDDPLNNEAADEYRLDPKRFQRSVDSYLYRYAK